MSENIIFLNTHPMKDTTLESNLSAEHELKSDEILIWVWTNTESLDFEWIKTIYIEKFWAELRTILYSWFNRDSLLNPCNSIDRVVGETNESFKARVDTWLSGERKREADARNANKAIFNRY